MPLSAIDDAQIVQLTPEETCLLLGSKMMAEPEKQYRFRRPILWAPPKRPAMRRACCSTASRMPTRRCSWFPSGLPRKTYSK